jgi:hypothetical protein
MSQFQRNSGPFLLYWHRLFPSEEPPDEIRPTCPAETTLAKGPAFLLDGLTRAVLLS